MTTDKLDREITVGSVIVYAQRVSSSVWLSLGKVLEVKPGMVKVIGAERYGALELNSRSGWVTNLSRVIVLDPAQVPENYRRVFE